MQMSQIPFVTVDWSEIPATRHAGDRGHALWRTQTFGPDDNRIRVRMVDYSPGYESNHWCSKGHVLLASKASSKPGSPTAAASRCARA